MEQKKKTKVAVLGGGEFATALAEILVKNGFNKVFSYMKKENNSKPLKFQMRETLEQYNLVHQILMCRNSEIRKLCEVNLDNQLRQYCSSFLESTGDKIDLKKFISNWLSYSGILYDWL